MRFYQCMLLWVCLALGLTSCSNEAPSCSSEEVTELIQKMVREKLDKKWANTNLMEQNPEIKVVAIRTTSTDETTGARSCAAQLSIGWRNRDEISDITYKVENTDDGEFFVTVFGI